MGLLSFAGSIYDLDTLDTRFTSSANVPYQTVIDARTDPAIPNSPKKLQKGSPSRWKTPEFYFYYAVIAVVLPLMFWVAFDVSRRRLNFHLTRDELESKSRLSFRPTI